jgi:hypothetical protein
MRTLHMMQTPGCIEDLYYYWTVITPFMPRAMCGVQ